MRKHSVETRTIGHQIEHTQFNKKPIQWALNARTDHRSLLKDYWLTTDQYISLFIHALQ